MRLSIRYRVRAAAGRNGLGRSIPIRSPSPRIPDMLIVCCTGGPGKPRLGRAGGVEALGPEGTLVNVSRGEVLDEAALIAALESGRLGSAGLDVFCNEPTPDPRFARLTNVALLPHVGSATVETRAAMAASVVTALVEVLG